MVTAADEAAVREHLAEGTADCIVVNPGRLSSTPSGFLSDVRRTDSARPVVRVTDDADALDDGAFGAATTVVKRAADALDWSFLVQKVRAALAGESDVVHSGTARKPTPLGVGGSA